MMGSHLINSWATSQPVVVLSSGEAELYALVKAAAQAKGLSSLFGDFGYVAGIDVHTVSTAALGIAHRQGLGKTRHIEVQYLWIQDNVHRNSIAVTKIGTKDNPADMVAKGVKREVFEEHLRFVNGHVFQTRAKSALTINSIGASDKWEKHDEQILVRIHCKQNAFSLR